jgi:hypothetical protein
MITPSVRHHPDLIALEHKLRNDLKQELADETRKNSAELRIFEALIKLEMSLLNKLPGQGDVMW